MQSGVDITAAIYAHNLCTRDEEQGGSSEDEKRKKERVKCLRRGHLSFGTSAELLLAARDPPGGPRARTRRLHFALFSAASTPTPPPSTSPPPHRDGTPPVCACCASAVRCLGILQMLCEVLKKASQVTLLRTTPFGSSLDTCRNACHLRSASEISSTAH